MINCKPVPPPEPTGKGVGNVKQAHKVLCHVAQLRDLLQTKISRGAGSEISGKD